MTSLFFNNKLSVGILYPLRSTTHHGNPMKKKIHHCMFMFLILFVTGCDRIEVENQISNKQQDIESIRTHNLHLMNEIKALSSQVARLNAGQSDGMVIEEMRKALTLKESLLQGRADKITKQEAALRISVAKIEKLQAKFYAETGVKREFIGEARQIKREYENMRTALDVANNRANNWLVYISVLIAAFVVSIVYLVFTAMRYSSQNRRVDNAITYLETSDIDDRNRRLIAGHLNRKLE